MKYAIIAAGEGSRLAHEGVTLPKPLVRVGGEALIDRLFRIFMDNDAEEIVVVCNDRTTQVAQHLATVQRDGLNGRPVPLRFVVKSTPSSMHSFYEISPYLHGGPFVLTTVDTIFRETEFRDYIRAFSLCDADGLMGVTDFVDDEKPLWVGTVSRVESGALSVEGGKRRVEITGFYDIPPSSLHSPLSSLLSHSSEERQFISAGIYGLKENALTTLNGCIERGEQRMRNFQRALISDGRRLLAFPFTKVLDIDHASDIEKATQFIVHHS